MRNSTRGTETYRTYAPPIAQDDQIDQVLSYYTIICGRKRVHAPTGEPIQPLSGSSAFDGLEYYEVVPKFREQLLKHR